MSSTRTTTATILLAGLALAGCAGGNDLPSIAPLTAAADEANGAPLPTNVGAADAPNGAPLPADVGAAGGQGAAPAEPEPVMPVDDGSGCVLAPEQVQSVLAEWVPPGGVEIIPELSNVYGSCTYRVTDGHFPQSGKYPISLRNGEKGVTFDAGRDRYADNQIVSRGIYNTSRSFGGSSAAEVFESSYIAARDVGAAAGLEHPVQRHPDVGGGLVVEGNGISFTLAGKDHWYRGGFSGMGGDPIYTEALVELATLIAENE